MTDFIAPLVGAHYRPPAKAILQVLPQGTELLLTPEPDNPFDANAVMVAVRSDAIPEAQHEALDAIATGFGFTLQDILGTEVWHLGYIARPQAAQLQGSAVALQGPTLAELRFDASGKPQVRLQSRGVDDA